MSKFIFAALLSALLLPSVAAAQDRGDGWGGGASDSREENEGDDFDLADYVLGRGDFAPNGRPAAQVGGDVLPEDLIDEICEDGDVIIIYGDDGSIEDWDCDFS